MQLFCSCVDRELFHTFTEQLQFFLVPKRKKTCCAKKEPGRLLKSFFSCCFPAVAFSKPLFSRKEKLLVCLQLLGCVLQQILRSADFRFFDHSILQLAVDLLQAVQAFFQTTFFWLFFERHFGASNLLGHHGCHSHDVFSQHFVGSCSCSQHSPATSSAFLLPLLASEQPSPAFLRFFVFFFLFFLLLFSFSCFFCSCFCFSLALLQASSLGLLLAGAPSLAKNVSTSSSSSSSSSPGALSSEAEGMQFSMEAFFGFVPSHIWSKKVSSSCPGCTLLIAFESALCCSSVVWPVPWFFTVCFPFLPMLTFSSTFKNCQIFKPFFKASGLFPIWMSPALTLCFPSSSPYSSVIFSKRPKPSLCFPPILVLLCPQ